MRADLAYYSSCRELGELLEEERKELAEIIRNKSFRKAVGLILERADALPQQLTTVNLLDPAGVMKAIELQAQYKACIQLFDDLLTQAGIGSEETKK